MVVSASIFSIYIAGSCIIRDYRSTSLLVLVHFAERKDVGSTKVLILEV